MAQATNVILLIGQLTAILLVLVVKQPIQSLSKFRSLVRGEGK
jgi:hypothetical protein